MVDLEGEQYSGEWKDDMKHGDGTFIWKERSYSGEWLNDSIDGVGVCRWSDGRSYKGQWSRS